MEQYDVIVIGAGVIGCAAARYLSRMTKSILVLEKEEDVCSGTSKANSGIVHAGFDAEPGTLKAAMNAEGCKMMPQLSQTLGFQFRQNGSLVLCFDAAQMPELQKLYDRGIANGIPQLKILTGDEVRSMEPNVSGQVVAALYAPTAGIVCPFSMTVAFAENAAANGTEFAFLEAVQEIRPQDGGFTVVTDKRTLKARAVVNAAGVYADVFHNMVSAEKIHITPRRGEYVLMDREVGDLVNCTVFQLPDKLGKGVLVTPTAHGNLLVGPNAQDLDDKENTEITAAGMEDIKARALRSVPNVPYNKTITGFAGLRAHGDRGDFVLGEPKDCPSFFDAACIESPGLTSAPAIGAYLARQIADRLGLTERQDFQAEREGFTAIAKLPPEERAKRIAERPEYGNIVCRCENISEGEIMDAIRRSPGAKSLDGIKRRVRQGMGRCQAGFCTPKTMEILARELGIPMTAVTKNRPGSEMVRCDDETA